MEEGGELMTSIMKRQKGRRERERGREREQENERKKAERGQTEFSSDDDDDDWQKEKKDEKICSSKLSKIKERENENTVIRSTSTIATRTLYKCR